MKIEYSLCPTDQVFHMMGTSSRILSSNLVNNPKIDVVFPKTCLNVDFKYYKYMQENYERIRQSLPFNLMISVHPWLVFTSIYNLTEEYKKTVQQFFKEEYVMLTISHLLDLITVKHLLEDNRKVIVGGSTVILFGSNYIRYILELMGAKNLQNLLLIRGYVDLNTDLYPLIRKWEDCEVSLTDPKSFWDCRYDFIQDHNRLAKIIYNRDHSFDNRFSYVTSMLTLECWWGKCMYCSYKDLPVFDFRDTPDKMAESIKDILNRYDEDSIRFTDSYFEFDDQNIVLLENLKEYDVRVVGGVHRMTDKNYVKNFNKYSRMISLGLECAEDDCLRRIKKGTNEKMIWKMVDNMIKYVDRDKNIIFCTIADLPFRNINAVKRNYENLAKIKRTLDDNGFTRAYFNISLLQIDETNKDSMFSLTPYIREHSGNTSGRYQFFEHIRDHDPVYMKKIFMPFTRYDDQGNMMASDYEIIGEEIEYLINTKEELDARDY